MNNFTFENQGTNTYLVYSVGENESIDSMSLGMLTNNKIPGLAPTIFTQMDASKFFKYNVSAHVSVSQFFSGPVNKKRLLGVFKGIVDAMLAAEDYMIDINTILLDLDYIFADVTTCESVLICLPIETQEAKNIDLSVFFKNIMFNTQFDQTENCDYVAKIMNYLNSTPVISLSDFKDLLANIDAEGTQAAPQPVVKQPVVQQPAVAEKKPVAKQPAVQSASTPAPASAPASAPAAPAPAQPAAVPPVAEKPQVAVPPTNAAPAQNAPKNEGKKMSFFDLMMHYSKENAELYKAQKAEQATAAAPAPAPAKKETNKKQSNAGFAIPGQAAPSTGFAIPGQAAPAVNSTPAPVPTPATPAQPAAKPAAPAQPATPAQQPATPAPAFVPRQVPQGQAANFGETTVLGGGAIGETTVLTASNNPTQTIAPHLIRKKNNEKISLNKPVFRIGKERSYVDYFVGDNTAISRSHANIIIREDSYFVVDTNSTNHTYVNGVMIQSNEEKAIAHGDIVKLANEEFEFRVY